MRRLLAMLVFSSVCLLIGTAQARTHHRHHHAITAAAAGADPVMLGDQNVEASSDGGTNSSEAFGYTATVTGTAQSISVYLTSTTGAQVALYANGSTGKPGARLGSGSVASNTTGWVTIPISGSASITSGTQYWLAIAASSGKKIAYRDKGTGGSNLDWALSGLSDPASLVKQWNSNPASVYLNGTVPAPVAPANTTRPAISGTPQQGQTLTASQGSWSGTTPITYTYAWSDGATGQTDTLTAADVGQNVSVTVTATNTAGSAQATSDTVGPVTAAPPATSSVFGNTTPGSVDAGADRQVNLGLQFHADRDGNILGVRFYKSTANTGTHVGTLFDASGSKLAQATFTSETASGWQDVQFSSPVAISAGAEYTVAYNTTVGHYADDHNYAWPHAAPPLTGDAGFYCYGTPDCLPTSTYQGGNYYVDVDYQATGTPPAPPANTTRPAVTGTAQQGSTLTVSNGTWTNNPASYAYQWQDCANGTCSNIASATNASYTLQASDVGDTVDASVTATNAGGSASATSDQTATVTAGSSSGNYTLPSDRTYPWNPGLNPAGGIPSAGWTVYRTISPSGGDDTATIQAALNSCPTNGVVQLTAGVFHITGSGLQLENSYCVLRGAGPGPGNWPVGAAASGTGGTYLEKPAGTSYPVAIIGPRWGTTSGNSGSVTTNLTADAAKGANSVTVASTTGMTAGQLVVVNETTDPNVSHWQTASDANNGWFEQVNRPVGDTLQIQSISGNTVTFTTTIPIAYQVAQAAHLYTIQNQVNDAGIEDLYYYRGEGGDGGGGIHISNCAHCWVKHIEASYNDEPVNIDQSFGTEVRDSYIHDAPGGLHSGSSSYGVAVNWYSSNTLVENNVVVRFNKIDVFRSAGGGNVFGYNYLDDGADLGGQWMETVMNSSHMTTPHYELFEGNQSANFDQDDRWGNSVDITIFRNDLTGFNRDYSQYGPLRAAGVTQWHTNQSFVGNVLGTPAHPGITGYEGLGASQSGGTMWMVCWQNNDGNPDGGKCQSSILRDGNFDYFSNEVHWHGIGGTGVNNGLTPPANSTLPDSMYLTGKPGFFGSNAWPWVDGSNATAPLPGSLPARTRYDAGTPNAVQ